MVEIKFVCTIAPHAKHVLGSYVPVFVSLPWKQHRWWTLVS